MPDYTHIRVGRDVAVALTGLARAQSTSVDDLLSEIMRDGLSSRDVARVQWVADLRKLQAAVVVLDSYEHYIIDALAQEVGSRAARYTTQIYERAVENLEDIINVFGADAVEAGEAEVEEEPDEEQGDGEEES